MIYEKRGTSVCISQFQIFKRVTKEEVYQYIRNAEKMEEDKYFIGILFTIQYIYIILGIRNTTDKYFLNTIVLFPTFLIL